MSTISRLTDGQANFKPDVGGWGQKGLLHCATILDQIKDRPPVPDVNQDPVKQEDDHQAPPLKRMPPNSPSPDDVPPKRVKTEMSVEEYEAMLDAEDDAGGFLVP